MARRAGREDSNEPSAKRAAKAHDGAEDASGSMDAEMSSATPVAAPLASAGNGGSSSAPSTQGCVVRGGNGSRPHSRPRAR